MTDDAAQANKALLRRFYKEVYGEWNMTMVNEVVTPEFLSHDWPLGGPTGPQAFQSYYAALRSAVPDAHYEVDDVIAEDAKVVVRWRLLGTHQGAFGSIAPSGKPIMLKGIAIYRVESGKLVERWVVSDLYGLLEETRRTSGC